MRTSLNEIKIIEEYLKGTLDTNERSGFEDRLKNDEDLRIKLFLQNKIYVLLHFYRRKKIKAVAESVYDELMSDPLQIAFRNSVQEIFTIRKQ